MIRILCLALVIAIFAAPSFGATALYVDPDWTGSQTGAASTPWTYLSSSAWSAINSALSSGAVTVYFSARNASSDSNETTTAGINLGRTNTSSNLLVLDGMSKYNTSDSSPSWADYTGTSRFQITGSYPVSPGSYVPMSNVTFRGFRIIATDGQILWWWGGNNVTIEENELSSSPGSSTGPGLYFQYTKEEGSGCPSSSGRESCTRFNNIKIRNNYVHDTFGEGIYIGGCANNSGCLGHTGVTIEGNTIKNPAQYGGERDAIDIKDGITGLVVRGNTIITQLGASRTGICTESGGIYERNYIQDAGAIGIMLSTGWNSSGATRNGSIVRNNIVVRCGGDLTGSYSRHFGILIDSAASGGVGSGDHYTNLQICNNTVFNTTSGGGAGAGNGITVWEPGTVVQNNISFQSEGVPFETSVALGAHDYNLYFKSGTNAIVAKSASGSYTASQITSFESHSKSGDPMFVSTSLPYLPQNFKTATGSPAISAALTLTSFNNDYYNLTRVLWSIGAIEVNTSTTALSPPTNLRVSP